MKTKQYLIYALLGLVTLQFSLAGGLKVIGFDPLYQQLAALHVGRTGGFLIGLAEVIGAVGIWIRPMRRLALLGLQMLAVGAIAVHVGAGQPITESVPAMVATAALVTLVLLTEPGRFRTQKAVA
jgi:putative oxidoreductase